MAGKSQVYIGNECWNVEHFARHVLQERLSSKTFDVFDLADLVHKCENWKKKMPRVRPYYAVKCNNNQVALRVLSAFGAGFDCASEAEIKLVLSNGVSPNSIIFAHTAKPHEHLKFARDNGVDLLTFDGDFELIKTKYYYPNARLIIRIRSDALVAKCPLGDKYGCCPDNDAPKLLKLAKKLNLNVVGVSFHVGSGCEDDNAHAVGIRKARKLFDFGKTLGYDMNILDIGGGFLGDVGTSIDNITKRITQSLDEYFPEGCGVDIVAEPGRYFVASAFTLACCVHSARIGASNVMYFMDNGIYGSFAGVTVDRLLLNPRPLDVNDSPLINASLWGPTCDGIDVVMKNVMLPKMPLPSWLLFESFGAYTTTTSTNFNGFGQPDEYIFTTKRTWDRLCALEGFDSKAIEILELPENLPKKWQHFGPQTDNLYTPKKPEPKKCEKTHVMMFQERLKMEFSPTKPDLIHSP